ncbi:MAG: DNA repair protein RadA [Candidatus Shapirobacteria bacterium]
MAKTRTSFICQNCNCSSPKWLGQCPNCSAWNTLVETVIKSPTKSQNSASLSAFNLKQIKKEKIGKTETNIKELDQVLGGGLVPGQVVLFSGEPGIGKSTLLTQLALSLPHRQTIYYVCGEESPEQVFLRVKRLQKTSLKNSNLFLLPATNVDQIIDYLNQTPALASPAKEAGGPPLVIIDSIQSLSTADLSGMAGSVGQVRESAQRLISFAKRNYVPTLLVGHVTKQGNIAGPKVLEHAVDTVIYFEGEKRANLRLLRTTKNRFGPTDEVGLFQMTARGLIPAENEILIKNLTSTKVGSAFTVAEEGSRLLNSEIQALTTQSFTPYPKRVITGLSRNRAEMLIAVTQKYLYLPLFKYDIFLNVAGGLTIKEPAVDLAVCASLYSSYKSKPLPALSSFWGEVSLLGEVGKASQETGRKKQARNLGIKKIFNQNRIGNIRELKKIF